MKFLGKPLEHQSKMSRKYLKCLSSKVERLSDLCPQFCDNYPSYMSKANVHCEWIDPQNGVRNPIVVVDPLRMHFDNAHYNQISHLVLSPGRVPVSRELGW